MMFVSAHDFASWRTEARQLLRAGVHPLHVLWNSEETQPGLFADTVPRHPNAASNHAVPANFLTLAEIVAHHRNPERFSLLYHMLWRLTYESKYLLNIASDPLTHALYLMQKSVRRDVHKTKAFVRFREIMDDDGTPHYIAWHCPDHYSLRLSAPFFQRRFTAMRWSILTPDESVHWNGARLQYGKGAAAGDAPAEDAMEVLWKDFYRAIFNPARIKIAAMKKEMPVRHWKTLPEAAIIPALLAEAPERVEQMIATQEGYGKAVSDFMPALRDLPHLRDAAKGCQGCPLYRDATHTVFGTGPADARMVLVGEQPGDEEDKQGLPFIGPAGKLLDRALADAGLDRAKLYVTNSVKHFKFSYAEGERYHRTPSLREVTGCKPWLMAELEAIKPELVVCLGLTATRALLSSSVKLQNVRGQFFTQGQFTLFPTYHPSAILRSSDSERLYADLVSDLHLARSLLDSST